MRVCVCALGVRIVCEGGRKGFEGKTELTLSLFLPSFDTNHHCAHRAKKRRLLKNKRRRKKRMKELLLAKQQQKAEAEAGGAEAAVQVWVYMGRLCVDLFYCLGE